MSWDHSGGRVFFKNTRILNGAELGLRAVRVSTIVRQCRRNGVWTPAQDSEEAEQLTVLTTRQAFLLPGTNDLDFPFERETVFVRKGSEMGGSWWELRRFIEDGDSITMRLVPAHIRAGQLPFDVPPVLSMEELSKVDITAFADGLRERSLNTAQVVSVFNEWRKAMERRSSGMESEPEAREPDKYAPRERVFGDGEC